MHTKTRTFTSPQFGSVRTAGTPENPLFCLMDLGKALGLKDPIKVSDRLNREDKAYVKTSRKHQGRYDGIVFVTIRGMRDALLNSTSKKGDLIYNWLSRDVVPALTSKKKALCKPATKPQKNVSPVISASQGIIPFLKQKNVVESKGNEILTIEDCVRLVSHIDNVTKKAADALGGLSSAEIQSHLDTLLDYTFKVKDSLLDIMKDIVLYSGYREAKTA